MGARWVAPMAATVGLFGLLVGCGGDDDPGAATVVGSEETTAAESTGTTRRETTESTTTTTTSPPPSTEAPPTTLATSGAKLWSSLRAGECVVAIPEGTFTEVELSRCDEPHGAETFGTVFISGFDEALGRTPEDQAQGGCEGKFQEYAGRPLDGTGLIVLPLISAPETSLGPTTYSATIPAPNERTVICLAENADGTPLTAPIAG